MANNFNIVARLNLQGPNNIKQVIRQIQSQLNSVTANVQINVANNINQRLNTLNTNLQRVQANLLAIRTSATSANQAMQQLAASFANVRGSSNVTVTVKGLNNITGAANRANAAISSFGGQAGLAVRRFLAFAAPTSIFLGLVAAIKEGVSASIEFEREMTRLSQVTGRSVTSLSDLSDEITRLATGLGVSSKELSSVSTTLAQAGLSARDTKIALEALARSSLAATFTDIASTTEGAIATFQQFKVGAEDLQGVVGSLNAVSAQFAVESDDLVSAIRRTGGAFNASGGSLNELLGLFTSVRATTRESADSIATGFRTIFTRIQRPRTIQFLKELGVELQNAKGQFIGPLESIRRLNAALSEIQTTDPRFAAVIEELGGFRQVSKVIPLIQQFPEALKAISVAEQGQLSIVEDSITAQKSLANQITKVKEEFLALFRELTSDQSFQFFVKTILELARGLIDVTRAIKPLIPLLGSLALVKLGGNIGSLSQDFLSTVRGRKKFATGGTVPGAGNGDTVPAMLTPGEFVINKRSAQAIGFNTLARMNKFADGGPVRQFGLAALNPTGFKQKNRQKISFKDPSKKGISTEIVDIFVGGLSKSFAAQTEKHIANKVATVSSTIAAQLQKQIGSEQSQPANVQGVIKKTGLSAIVGNIFEASLALAGAPYKDKAGERSPIDFPHGIGNLAPLFGKDFPSKIPVDAKRHADIELFKKRNIRSFLQEEARKRSGIVNTTNRIKLGGLQGTVDSLSASDKEFVKSVATGQSRLDSNRSKIEKLLGIKGVKVRQLAALRFAEGGGVPGSGGGDSVPSLLTPGEFVVNKQAASKIGLPTLRSLNNFQKFAKGGLVGSASAGTSGFALAGILSLSTSFLELDQQTEKLVNSFTAVVGAASVLAFTTRSLASERQLGKLSTLSSRINKAGFNVGFGGSTVGPGKNTALVKASSALAQNFDTLAFGLSAASAALTVYGQSLQDASLKQAKLATTQTQLDKAIASNQTGGIASSGGIGAGVGAAIGTAIAPGIGTAIGAAIGGIGGLIVGALNTNSDELIKVFRQAKFDEVAEKLDVFVDDFSSGRVNANRTAPNVAQALRAQLSNISSTSDSEQRAELTKQLRNQLVNIRTLSSEIIKNVSSLQEFRTAFGGAGNTFIETISVLTNRSFPEIIEQIEAEITARNKAIERIERETSAVRETEKLVTSIKTFNDSIQNVNDSLAQSQTIFDGIASLGSGGGSGGRFNNIAPGLFNRAAAGGISNAGRVSSAVNQLTASLDADSTKSINDTAVSIAKLTNVLPDILDKVASNVGLGADSERVFDVFEREINSLGGVSDDIKRVAKAIFASEIASREGGGEGGIAKSIREDVVGFANKLVPEALKASVQQLDEINKNIADQLEIIGKRLTESAQLELSIVKQKVDIEERILDISKTRLLDGKRLTDESIQQTTARRQTALLQGTGFGAGAGVGAIGNRLRQLPGELTAQQNVLNAAGAGTKAQIDAQVAIVGLQTEAQRLTNFLKDVSESSLELARAQENLTRAEEDRRSGKNLVEELLFGPGSDRAAFARFTKNLQSVTGGKQNIGSLAPAQRKEFLDFLGKLPQNKALGALGGKTVGDFRNEQLRESFIARAKAEGADVGKAEELINALTTQTKDEEKARDKLVEVQTNALNAELELIRSNESLKASLDSLNTKLITDLPGQIKAAIAEAVISGLSEQEKFIGREASGRQAQLGRLDFLGNQLGTGSREKTLDFVKRFKTNEDLFRQRGSSLSRINEIKNLPVNAGGIASSLSRDSSFDGSAFGGKKINKDVLNTVLNSQLAGIAQPGDRDKLRNQITGRLSGTVFQNGRGFATEGFQGQKTPFGESFAFNPTGEFSMENILNRIIQEEVDKFQTQEKGVAARSGFDAQKGLGRAGFSFEQIEQFSKADTLKNFSDRIAELDESLFKGAEPLKNYVKGISELNAQLDQIRAKIGALQPDAAPGKAGGGFIGGRGISKSLTSFVPKGTDRIPAMLSKGEFVVNSASAKAHAKLLEFINGNKNAIDGVSAGTSLLGKGAERAFGFARGGRVLEILRRRRADRIARADIRRRSKPTLFGDEAAPRNLIGPAAAAEFARQRKEAFAGIGFAAQRSQLLRNRGQRAIAANKGVAQRQSDQRLIDLIDSGNIRGQAAIKIRDRLSRRSRIGFANGGPVPGSGKGDNVPALLTPGEFVLNRRATKSLGLNTLKNFNARFATGGVVTGGGGSGGVLTLDTEAMTVLQTFGKGFTDSVNAFGGNISRFSEISSTLTNALSTWSGVANRLSETLLSFPTEIQVNHSPITVAVNVAGIEGLEQSIQDKVLAAVDQRLANSRAKAADGKNPFLSK